MQGTESHMGGLFASLSMVVFKASGMGEITQCTRNLYQLEDLSSDRGPEFRFLERVQS